MDHHEDLHIEGEGQFRQFPLRIVAKVTNGLLGSPYANSLILSANAATEGRSTNDLLPEHQMLVVNHFSGVMTLVDWNSGIFLE